MTVSEKSCISPFSHKKHKGPIWPCRKLGQGQPRVIIWTNLVVLEYPMLHTNFQGHRLFGSREEDFFKRFLPYMGMTAILVMWPGPFEQTFILPSHGGSAWNLASISQAISKEKKFENVNLSDLGSRSINDFDIHKGSCSHLDNCIYQFWHHRLQQFLKNPLFYLWPRQKHKRPNLTLL